MTRTYVHYFGFDQIEPLETMLSEIALDWSKRRDHVDREIAEAGDERLAMATLAIKRLKDRVA